jgi:ubiquinone/menaquinone biosynthesis C-methylase UbiE
MKNRPFGLLARFYDRISVGTGAMNRHARAKVLGKRLAAAQVVCDLACGSGETAIELAREGRRVYAVDNSAEFLRTVREKARKSGAHVRTLRADMRNFWLPEKVDVLLCEFAALNALDRRSDLAKVFRAVARALRPGGTFAFDVNTPLSFRTQVPAGHWMETPEFKLVMHGSCEDGGLRAPLHLEWFLPERGRFRHVRETIVHVSWTESEIRRELLRAGFISIRTFDGADVRPKEMKAPRGTDLYFRVEKDVLTQPLRIRSRRPGRSRSR